MRRCDAGRLDDVFTKTNELYGLPSFGYHGNVVSWFWRYACPQFPCYKGGFVSSALAFSYNSKNFSAFGQFAFPESSSPPAVAAAAAAAARDLRGTIRYSYHHYSSCCYRLIT